MMAPGLPEVALRYGITNPTAIALTLSIFLLSFAIGVRMPYYKIQWMWEAHVLARTYLAPHLCTSV